MLAVTAAFIVIAPLTPFWPLYCRRSEWGRSLRSALWIRSVTSLLLLISVVRRTYLRGWLPLPVYIEALAGSSVYQLLRPLTRWSGNLFPARGMAHTALMTLFTGLILLGVAGVVAIIVRGIIAFAARIAEDNRTRIRNSGGDY